MQHYTLPQNIKLRTSSHLDVFREFNFKHQKSQKICPINKKKTEIGQIKIVPTFK